MRMDILIQFYLPTLTFEFPTIFMHHKVVFFGFFFPTI